MTNSAVLKLLPIHSTTAAENSGFKYTRTHSARMKVGRLGEEKGSIKGEMVNWVTPT